jgi:hypothetical protein
MGNPMPAESTIMNSLDNSSMEAGGGVGGNGGVGGSPGGLSEPDQMNKSSLDKPIIGDSVTAITNQKNKVSVLYGFCCSTDLQCYQNFFGGSVDTFRSLLTSIVKGGK